MSKPATGPLDLAALFGNRVDSVRLEIGFGGGEHLLAAATAHPSTGFIGCEPFVNGVAKILARIESDGLGNIRIWDADVTDLLPAVPDGSLERIDVLYPDPWPKRRQRKRRLVSPQLLDSFARILRPGGRFRFATDIDDYAGWVLARIAASPAFGWTARGRDDWSLPPADWPGTRYERKALAAGRRPIYLDFVNAASDRAGRAREFR